MLSKTAAKRQAHRESSMHRYPGEGWEVVVQGEIKPWGQGLAFAAARAELAAWRAARVRELMGERPPCARCGHRWEAHSAPSHPTGCTDCRHEGAVVPCRSYQASKTSAPPAAPEARGDSSLPGEKGGTDFEVERQALDLTRGILFCRRGQGPGQP